MRRMMAGPVLVVAVAGFTGCTADTSDLTEKKPAVVRIEAGPSTCWSGSIGEATRDGCGDARFDVESSFGNVVSANVQKKSDDVSPVSIIIEIDGQEKARNTTTAAYGVAQAASS